MLLKIPAFLVPRFKEDINNFPRIRSFAFAVLFLWLVSPPMAQNQSIENKPLVKLTLVQEVDGLFVTSTDATSEFIFEVFLLSGQRVYASEPSRAGLVKLPNAEGKPLADVQYLYIATSKVSPTALIRYFGRLTIQSGKAEMHDSSEVLSAYERHYFAQRNLSLEPDTKQEAIDAEFRLFQAKANAAVEFFNLAVKLIPNSAEALLGQGFAIAATSGLSGSQMEEMMDPPTPPPPPPPAPHGHAGKQSTTPSPKARELKINREGLLSAIDAFKQGILVSDCESRSEAVLFLSAIYTKLNAMDQARDWRLKSVEMDCATAITRAMAYYSLAVENWQCANAITERYTDQKRSDPWHPRQITAPADQEKLTTCLARGLEYIEKALFDEPDNHKAEFYKSMLYREKQKTAKLKAERLKYAGLAEKSTQRTMEHFERASKQQ